VKVLKEKEEGGEREKREENCQRKALRGGREGQRGGGQRRPREERKEEF